MMELSASERLRDHLLTQRDGVCEQAAKSDLNYQGFLARALEAEARASATGDRPVADGQVSMAQNPGVVRLRVPALP